MIASEWLHVGAAGFWLLLLALSALPPLGFWDKWKLTNDDVTDRGEPLDVATEIEDDWCRIAMKDGVDEIRAPEPDEWRDHR
jgi:hypothetical protein